MLRGEWIRRIKPHLNPDSTIKYAGICAIPPQKGPPKRIRSGHPPANNPF
jgi:hypothetical protein